jgi:hypothetical protein
MSLAQLQTGPQAVGPAAFPIRRGSRDACAVIQEGHGKFQEAVYRGNVFAVADQTGKTMPAGLSDSPTTVTLFNPKGSNMLAVIWWGGVVSTVDPGAGIAEIWVASNSIISAADPTGTAAAPRNCMIGNAKAPSITTLTTVTLPAAPVAIDVLGVFLSGLITVETQHAALGKWYDGALILYPGGALSFQASAASGAAAAFGSWIWEEVLL